MSDKKKTRRNPEQCVAAMQVALLQVKIDQERDWDGWQAEPWFKGNSFPPPPRRAIPDLRRVEVTEDYAREYYLGTYMTVRKEWNRKKNGGVHAPRCHGHDAVDAIAAGVARRAVGLDAHQRATLSQRLAMEALRMAASANDSEAPYKQTELTF